MTTLAYRQLFDDPITPLPERAFIMITETETGLQVTYTEPSTNVDGSPLTDLASTKVEMTTSADDPVQEKATPATSPSGGQEISVEFPYSFVDGFEGDVTFALHSTDDNGNSGAPVIVVHHIDRLAPGPVLFST
jgi:hypothetical protein